MTTATIVITDDDLMNLVAKLFIQKAKRVNIGNAINPKVNARPKDVADSLIDQTGALNCCTKELGSIRLDLVQLLTIVKHTEPKHPDTSGFWVALSDPAFIQEISPILSLICGFEKSILARYDTDGTITSYTNQWFHHRSYNDKSAELMEPPYLMLYCNPFMRGFVKTPAGNNRAKTTNIDEFSIVVEEKPDFSEFPEKLLKILASENSIDASDAKAIKTFAEKLQEILSADSMLKPHTLLKPYYIDALEVIANAVLDLLWDPSIRTT